MSSPGRAPMPSPFPGMDPFLEHAGIFPDLHDSLIVYLSESIQKWLPEPYYASIGRRLWVESVQRSIGHLSNDEQRETFVGIYRLQEGGDRLVTRIEVLSPTNKTP